MYQQQGRSELRDSTTYTLLADTERLVLAYSTPINRSALQVYYSAVTTMPSCLLWETLGQHCEGIPLLVSQRTSGWGSRVRIIYEDTDAAVLSPDGRFILSRPRTARVWDVATETQLHCTPDTSRFCLAVAFSPDSQNVSCGFDDGTVEVWTIASWAKQAVLPSYSNGSVAAVMFTPHSKSVVSAFEDETVRFWALAQQTQEVFITGCNISSRSSLIKVVFTLDCRFMAAAKCDDGAARAWKLVPGAPLDPLVIARPADGEYYTAAFSPDGCSVVFGAEDGVHVWDTATSTHRLTINGHSSRVTAVAFSHDGQSLVSGFDDAMIMVWNFTAGAQQPDYVLKGHGNHVTSVAFSPDAKFVFSTSSDDRTMRVWSGAASVDESVMEGHTGAVSDLAFSHDGQHIASGSEDRTIRVWDAATGRQKYVLEGHKRGIKRVVFSSDSDSQTIASCSWDRTVRTWNVTTGTQVHAVLHHPWLPYDVVFSHDGQSVSVISDPDYSDGANEVYVWEVKTGTQRFVISLSLWEPVQQLNWLIFSPSDRLVVAAFYSDATSSLSGRSDEQSIDYKVWDASTGVELAVQDLTPALVRDIDGALLSRNEEGVASYHARMAYDGWVQVSQDANNWHPVCWLPAERRSSPLCPYACRGEKVCIGARSGAVTILDLSNVHMPWARSL
jgi:WD40 repeat protein